MTPERRVELERQYDEFAGMGWPAASLLAFRRAHGLPIEPAPTPTVVVRPAPSLARRPRRAPKKAAPASKDPVAQARGRFDLLEFEDTND